MREFACRLVSCLDLTSLASSCTSADVMVLCEQAKTRHGNVAAVCIYPQWVETAKQALQGSDIHVATVINFPQPTLSSDEIQAAIAQAIEQGADELDVVMPYDLLAQGGESRVAKILQCCRQACGDRVLKIIIESGALQSRELIQQATQLVVDSGADFVKTSTGKVPVGATLSAVETIVATLQNSGAKTGIKLSGGIRTVVSAYEYVQLIERYLGVDMLQPARFRIGASQLLQDITRQIEQPL